MADILRAAAPVLTTHDNLGLLGELPGTWVGSGFNLVSLPDQQNGNVFRVKVNATRETLSFTTIGGQIPNRGSVENDISFVGLHYFQQVTDAITNGGLHVEPGLWLNMPKEGAPPSDDPLQQQLVRLGTIPHGDTILALSTVLLDIAGPPEIAVENTTPIPFGSTTPFPTVNDPYLQPFSDAAATLQSLLAIDPAAIQDPNLVLKTAIAGQDITNTKVIVISTSGVQNTGMTNVPFVVNNANAVSLDAIFWIETVSQAGGNPFLQLQYTQRIILDFANVHWPHISVATLIKQ